MYRFQVRAHTQIGEAIGILGSTAQLGAWDVTKCVRLRTRSDQYPLWWVDLDPTLGIAAADLPTSLEYKYVRLLADDTLDWETQAHNRSVPFELNHQGNMLVVDDGMFGIVRPHPYGYLANPVPRTPLPQTPQGLKIIIIGSSVALGCNAWLLKGWAYLLEQALHNQFGHQVVNLSEIGANVSRTIDRFPLTIAPENPDIVIVSLSLGNEGLAHCAPHDRRAVQRRFESGLQQLVKMIRELGAMPMLGGVYPNGDYGPEHHWLLRDTHNRMLSWGVPIFDWLGVLDDGQGRWQDGLAIDPAHPNSAGHRRMFEAIDQQLFQIDTHRMAQEKRLPYQKLEVPIYSDHKDFHLFVCNEERCLRIINTSKYPYTLHPDWQDLQTALQERAKLVPGLYVPANGSDLSFAVDDRGTITSVVEIPPASDIEYSAACNFFAPSHSEILYYDGNVGLLQESDRLLRVINESDQEYNIHPMWQEVRTALQAMPHGVYDDPTRPDAPFSTLLIGKHGLESRVKAAPHSSILFQFKCPLSDISRVAILPLGDRCAIRMLLYKLEYDGPAFPFDLTRTTKVSDVADAIASNFYDMWNPALLHYNHDHRRVYHTRWSGLSFAHEVEESDDPVNHMQPVYDRMRVRYSARAGRFWYTLRHCDKVLFVRTGIADRGSIIDLASKLESRCQGKPWRLLVISPQSSDEFADLPNVVHYDQEFNPDRMYEDLGYWMYCTDIMREILDSLGVSSKNLFWCPPNLPKEEWEPIS
ncbi:lipase [Leptolyngbya sp. 'hensonii']|uniref:GDSL-type esterase/lipase family protein n=1 Tax=Leptolyngbya sp. 'hensonii' TaxID=1922337 RepID=UPI00094F77BF|nr:DUF1796 family putative cysteine peptidase [Leptolyngbya sp. 'hensonii']OLP17693.1 lipase [Leptolyngbya sp. 'hensonii']